ncbi:MAG TPA: RluA family pseudouridine synthase [Longimicrobiales bacterium]|nr:RluA family pseudouridine synthase [Longimicrobiales bacterium]
MADDADVSVRRRIVVEEPASRLDAYLAGRLPDLSRTRIAHLLADGHVTLNGQVPRKSEALHAGDVVEIEVPPPEPSEIPPEDLPVDIVYQDGDLAVVNKAAGMVTHPAPGHRTGTLVNALLHHVGDLSGIGGVLRPGIVHRLDRGTSGLLIVAKHDRAHRRLAAELKRREIRRTYLACCWGHVQDRQTIDAPLGRSHGDRKRMAVVEGGRRAVTHTERLERWQAADLLRVRLETGRTHQIRVHLAWTGHPVVGDATYGAGWERGMSGPVREWARELARRVPRQFLHAAELDFHHPRTGAPMHVEAPLPPDLADVAEWASRTSGAADKR